MRIFAFDRETIPNTDTPVTILGSMLTLCIASVMPTDGSQKGEKGDPVHEWLIFEYRITPNDLEELSQSSFRKQIGEARTSSPSVKKRMA